MTKELTGNEIKSTIDEKYHSLIGSVEADHIVLKNEKEKLLSFFESLKNESLMMLAHIIYPKIDKEVATYSKKINSIIRNELFFKGLILTDDISMKALSDNLSVIIKKSYSAGCDVILHCSGKLDEVKKLYDHTKKIKKNIMITSLMIF